MLGRLACDKKRSQFNSQQDRKYTSIKTRYLLITLATVLGVAVLFTRVGPVLAGPAAPLVVSLVQPDGSTIQARSFGDEWFSGYETLDGYTVAQNKVTGVWHYATLDAEGQLIPSTLRPDQDQPIGIDPHLREDQSRSPRRFAIYPPGTAGSERQPQNIGTQDAVVILIEFNDRKSVGSTAAQWQSRFFGATNSVKHYYDEVSYSQLELSPADESHGTKNDGVIGWLNIGYDHPDTREDTNNRNRQLLHDAIVAADPHIDYSSYDADSDGYISPSELHVTVIAAGYETSYGGEATACTPGVWGHQWHLGTEYDGTTIDAPTVDKVIVGHHSVGGGYTQFGEWHCSNKDKPGHMATLGIMVHEMGHDLNWPDLYDTDESSDGVGSWSLMGSGSWLASSGHDGTSPAHPDAFSKWYQGWLTPYQVPRTQTGVALSQVETGKRVVQLLHNPNAIDWVFGGSSGTGEYFLVENRQKVGYDSGLPGCGLLIWHVDETRDSSNAANADDSRRLVDLEEADGQNHLDSEANDNRGDAGDPYPGTSSNRSFGSSTTPNSDLYGDASIEVGLTNISQSCSSTMTADFTIRLIESPTTTNAAFAGPHSAPTKVAVSILKPTSGLRRGDFTVRIGGNDASVVTVHEGSTEYVLEVLPPSQAANGSYALEVTVFGVSDTQPGAIYHADANNVDVDLVIDRSGSMGDEGKMDSAKEAAKQFVDLVHTDDMIGVVSFDDRIETNFPLTSVTASGVRDQAKNAVTALFARGSTSIGGGLQRGQEQLTALGKPSHPWAMVLLSDGLENRDPRVATVLPAIVASKTVVHTIGLGSDADEPLMQNIASQTGGTYHFAPGPGELAGIYNTIAGAVSGQQVLFSETGTVQQGAADEKKVVVDSTITEATFSISWSNANARLDLTLKKPTGATVDPSVASTDPSIDFVSGSTYQYYRIRQPSTGVWTMRVNGSPVPLTATQGTQTYTAITTGVTRLTLHTYLDKENYTTRDAVQISATLSDYRAITGATVTCRVQPPSTFSAMLATIPWIQINGDPVPEPEAFARLRAETAVPVSTFKLFDDGNHGDGAANDGVYANSFTDTGRDGSYSFEVQAEGRSNKGETFTRKAKTSTYIAPGPGRTWPIFLPAIRKGSMRQVQWTAGAGIRDRAVYGLAVDPANCNTLYAATDQGLYKSTDGGNVMEVHRTEQRPRRPGAGRRRPTLRQGRRRLRELDARLGSDHRSQQRPGDLCHHLGPGRLQEHQRRCLLGADQQRAGLPVAVWPHHGSCQQPDTVHRRPRASGRSGRRRVQEHQWRYVMVPGGQRPEQPQRPRPGRGPTQPQRGLHRHAGGHL